MMTDFSMRTSIANARDNFLRMFLLFAFVCCLCLLSGILARCTNMFLETSSIKLIEMLLRLQLTDVCFVFELTVPWLVDLGSSLFNPQYRATQTMFDVWN